MKVRNYMSLSDSKKMKYKHVVAMATPIAIFFIILFITHPSIVSYRFKKSAIPLYERSQDIPHAVKDRIFLSDSDIHIAAGYLYVTGHEPIAYNFQHPPLVKYLFGYSTLLFKTPYVIQILLAITYLILSYLFAWRITKSFPISAVSTLFLATDPVLHDVASQALLDLGQSVFALSFVMASLFIPGSFILQGILLGLFAASKFWSTALFFFAATVIYRRLTTKKWHIIHLLKTMGVAGIVFCLVYSSSFIARKGAFNIIFFQLKILKYWFHQSLSSMPAASLLLFMTGYVKSWWGSRDWVWTKPWSIFWPVTFIFTLCMIAQRKMTNELKFTSILPIIFLIYLGAQAPFTRYFVIILPYLYVCLSFALFSLVKKIFIKK